MASNGANIQDQFLTHLLAEGSKINPVAIYLVNGIKLQGVVSGFNQEVILLKNGDITQMVYKHSISTIVPSRAVDVSAV